MSCGIPLLSSLQAVPWWCQKWGLALHHVLLWVALCAVGGALISTKALSTVLNVTAHPWLSCDKHPSADSCTPGLSCLTALPMHYCLFLPLSARAAGPPELLSLFTHCQCFLLCKYAPMHLCSWGISFLFYLLLFPGPHLFIALSTQWPNNSQGDK